MRTKQRQEKWAAAKRIGWTGRDRFSNIVDRPEGETGGSAAVSTVWTTVWKRGKKQQETASFFLVALLFPSLIACNFTRRGLVANHL